MKKFLIALFSVVVVAMACESALARTTSNSALASAIRLYKGGNYAQAYSSFSNIVKNDPSNAVAYYYLAVSSAQLGRKNEAIANYEKVINLSNNSQLLYYAKKGKVCLENPVKCNEPDDEESDLDRFIRSRFGTGFSNQAQSEHEKQKIQNIMREMNRKDDLTPRDFKGYKDFSAQAPSNDEIVAALRTLQNAGLSNIVNGYNTDLSLLYNNDNNQMLNALTGNANSGLSPQVIQALLTNQMTGGF